MDTPFLQPVAFENHENAGTENRNIPAPFLRFIEQGMAPSLAERLSAELQEQSERVSHHREYNRITNAVYLDDLRRYNNGDQWHEAQHDEEIMLRLKRAIEAMPQYDSSELSFSGEASTAAAHVIEFASTARGRFQEKSLAVREKKSLALDLEYVDQNGDWDAPEQIDKVASAATDPTVLKTAGFTGKVVHHDRDHPMIHYEFWHVDDNLGERKGIMVVRKRPFADVGDIEIFRKSWFLVSASPTEHPELYARLQQARHGKGKDVRHKDNQAIAQFVHDMLIPEEQRPKGTLASGDKRDQSFVLPCTMTYIALVRNPNFVPDEVELES